MAEPTEVEDVKKSSKEVASRTGKLVARADKLRVRYRESPLSAPDGLTATGIRLGEELRTRLQAKADDQGISLGELCRGLLEDGMKENPDRTRTNLVRSVAITAAQFETALKAGVLKGTEAEEQAGEIRRFFGQFLALLKGEKESE